MKIKIAKKAILLWVVISCVLFLSAIGLIVTRIRFFSTANIVTTAKIVPQANVSQLLPAFDVHNPPLPPGWSSKESLPGNSFATAFSLNPGVKTQGTLNVENALDYYVFTLKDPSQIIIDVTDVPKTLSWVLYDAQFKEVAYTLRSGTKEGSTKISIQNPGKYYIRVWADYSGDSTNFPYTIRLSILPFFD